MMFEIWAVGEGTREEEVMVREQGDRKTQRERREEVARWDEATWPQKSV